MDFKISTLKNFLMTVNKLGVCNITEIANNTNTHYSWVINLVKYSNKMKFIKECKSKSKRERLYEITSKGIHFIKLVR